MTTEILDAYAVAAPPVAAMMGLVWLAGLPLRDASLVDRFWGLGFVLVAWSVFLQVPGGTPLRRQLLVGMTTLWGLRLSAYLTWRNWGGGEDRRYAAMRAGHGPRFWWVSLFTVHGLQGALALGIAAPLVLGQLGPATPAPTLLDGLGLALFLVGLGFETLGDLQLARFQADPASAGRVLDTGLWRYTRHPNYFGDACVWWGMYLVACGAGPGAWSFPGPLLMTVLLLKVSGVALLERDIAERRPGYREYVERTSAFLPWPPLRRS